MNLISGYDTFARNLFGVLQMQEIVEVAERPRDQNGRFTSGPPIPFDVVRDYFYDHLQPEVREGLRAMAKHLDGLERFSTSIRAAVHAGSVFAIPRDGEVRYIDAMSGDNMVKLPDDTVSKVKP